MGANSIRSNLTKEDSISEIRLVLSGDIEKKKVIVVVEGNDDVIFFNGKVSCDVILVESFSGKEGVKEIVNLSSNKNVIGICDKDYETECSETQIFYYDYSSLEIMMAMSDKAFSKVVDELMIDGYSPIELRRKLFADLRWLSLFRMLNYQQNWGIKFEGLAINKIFNKQNLNINIRKCSEEIINQNPNKKTYQEEIIDVVKQEYEKPIDYHVLPYITQGHDFMGYLHCYSDQKRYKVSNIIGLFRCTYSDEYFVQTDIFSAIKEYGESNGLAIWNDYQL